MGSFSWLKADIRSMKSESSLVNIAYDKSFKFLIPKEFGGGCIKEKYQDYGYLGTKEDGSPKYDMYELLALWNTVDGYFENAVEIRYDDINRNRLENPIRTNIVYSDLPKMKERDVLTDHIRNRGIHISEDGIYLKYTSGVYKEDGENYGKYPLKLVSPSYKGTYEDMEYASEQDPNQGWATTKKMFRAYNLDEYREVFCND